MSINVSTLVAAKAIANVAHIIQETNGTYTAYLHGELHLLPMHAISRIPFVIVGQSNATLTWTTSFLAQVTTATGRIAFMVNIAVGGSDIASWQPGQTNYNNFVGVNAGSELKGLRAALCWHGESAVIALLTEAAYKAAMISGPIAAAAVLGIKLMPCKLQDITYNSVNLDETAINSAIADLWATNANVVEGPDFHDINTMADGLHMASAGELQIAADRWYAAVDASGLLANP